MIPLHPSLSPIQACNRCPLHKNQRPLLDNRSVTDVLWVGLSAVRVADVHAEAPLSSLSRSGRLLSRIEARNCTIAYYRTNLVKCLPLRNGKLRYPSQPEMLNCYENLQLEIAALKPAVIVLLGQRVSNCVLSASNLPTHNLNRDFQYQTLDGSGLTFIPVHHPSFILIYNRKRADDYVQRIQGLLRQVVSDRRKELACIPRFAPPEPPPVRSIELSHQP